MESKEVLAKVRKIEIRTRKAVQSLMQGSYHSVFKGRGIEFSDVREYIPGDDTRSIDWNITARMNAPYVKEYIEERNLNICIVFDVSASSGFGLMKQKRESALELAASIMFSAARNNDKVGLCLFAEGIERYVKPRTGRKHILKLVSEIVSCREGRATDIKATLARLGKILKRRSIVFILSDFYSGDFSIELAILDRRHDIIAINLRDVREEEIPDIGYIHLEDAETGEQMVINTADAGFRRRYASLVQQKNRALARLFRKMGVDLIQLRSDEDYLIPIRRFFAMRKRRLAR
jgi:uncharacterized protein (DUF58 family)